MNFELYGFGPALLAGAWMTIKLALCSLALGLVLGLAGALAKTSPYRVLRWLGDAYSTMVRGVPELLWVLLIYYGSVSFVRELGEAIGYPELELSAFSAGVIALGLRSFVALYWLFLVGTVKLVWPLVYPARAFYFV